MALPLNVRSMGIQSLGIDISDSHLTGVVLEQQRKELVVRACLRLPLPDGADPADHIPLLCEQLDWRGGLCACGLPLSMLSIRNLILPFKDVKKIAQVLPSELEEQLLIPVETLMTDFSVVRKNGAGSSVVTFSLERVVLSGLLQKMQGVVDPEIITPAIASLTAQVTRHQKGQPNFLVINANQHASAMALVLHGQAIFYRRIASPEQMFLQSPFHLEEGHAEPADVVMVEESFQLVSQSIERSLEYFRMENKEEGHPEQVFLTGPLSAVPLFPEIIQAKLGLPVTVIDLLAANAISCPEPLQSQWRGRSFDCALSLALQGLRRAEINFRKEAFAKKQSFISSRRQVLGAISVAAVIVVCLFGFLWYDYYQLQQRDRVVGEEMTAIFKQTFHGVTKVREPFAEMQARVKSAQGPASPVLFLQRHKRVLDLLADISRRIPPTVSLRVSRLTIDRESVSLKGTTDTFNAVEIIKSSLASSSKFKSVQIVSATADKEKKGGSIRFEVQLQLEGI